MSIRHVVCFRWRDDAAPEAREAVRVALAALPAAIPEIMSYDLGHDASIRDGSWDFAIAAEFASKEDFLAYSTHPAHRSVVDELITPIAAERVSVQFET